MCKRGKKDRRAHRQELLKVHTRQDLIFTQRGKKNQLNHLKIIFARNFAHFSVMEIVWSIDVFSSFFFPPGLTTKAWTRVQLFT